MTDSVLSPGLEEALRALDILAAALADDDGEASYAADLLRFHGPTLNAPTEEKAVWLLSQMRHAKLLTMERAPEGAFRPDLLEEALGPPVVAKTAAPRKHKVAVAG